MLNIVETNIVGLGQPAATQARLKRASAKPPPLAKLKSRRQLTPAKPHQKTQPPFANSKAKNTTLRQKTQ
jgi:hypothetical protein